jgi:hypothetical protein
MLVRKEEAITSPLEGQSTWRTGPVRLADPKDPKMDPKKEATVVQTERGKLIALELPIAERAKLAQSSVRDGSRRFRTGRAGR